MTFEGKEIKAVDFFLSVVKVVKITVEVKEHTVLKLFYRM